MFAAPWARLALVVAPSLAGGCFFELADPVAVSDGGAGGTSAPEAGLDGDATAAAGPGSGGSAGAFDASSEQPPRADCFGTVPFDPPTGPAPDPLVAARFLEPPTIDGLVGEWSTHPRYPVSEPCLTCGQQYPISTVVDPSRPAAADLQATLRVGWDDDYLYLLVETADDELVVGAAPVDAGALGGAVKQDAVEVLVNFDLSSGGFGNDDRQLFFALDGTIEWPNQTEIPAPPSASSVHLGMGCYALEVRLAWQYLSRGVTTVAGAGYTMGLLVAVDDWDTPAAGALAERQSQLFTKDPDSQYWTQLGGFGTVRLEP